MFKRDAKKYTNFSDYLAKLTILNKAENFIDSLETSFQVYIEEDATKFILSLESPQDNEVHNHHIIEYDPDDNIFETNSQYDDSLDISVADESTKKFSTNDDINEEQLQWIHDEVKRSEYVKGKKTLYKCSICEVSLSTSASLVRHLRDLHFLVDTKKFADRKKNGFKIEVQRSKINVLSPHGLEAYWKCHRCDEDKVYKTERGLELHLRSSIHANEEFNEQEIITTWVCSEKGCTNLYGSYEEVEKHFMKLHPNEGKMFDVFKNEPSEEDARPFKKRKLNTQEDLTEAQHEWLRNQTDIGELIRGRKTVFICTQCKIELSTRASLTRHIRDIHILRNPNKDKEILKQESESSKFEVSTENGIDLIWKCFECSRVYKSEQAFKLHYKLSHKQAPVASSLIATCKSSIIENNEVRDVWKCPICNKQFKHRDGLRGHLKSEHPNMEEVEEKIAKEKSSDSSIFSKKFDRKMNVKNEESCYECGLKFLTAKHHVKPKVHRECHETFKTLAPHIPHHKCESCRMIFSTEEFLQIHYENHEDAEKNCLIAIDGRCMALYGAERFKEPTGDADTDDVCLDEVINEAWKCGHCTCKFVDENDLMSHQMLLHSVKLTCFVDNREFEGSSGQSKYIQHMKNKHPEYFPNLTYPCGSCGQEFPSIFEKLSHQKICDFKQFQCDNCDKKYSNKHQLQAHILFELGISGFSCEICGKRCKTMSDLKIHNNSHTNARPYQCS